MRKKIVAGNWKMNKTLEEGLLLVDEILKLESSAPSQDVLKIIAPPYLHLAAVAEKLMDQEGFEVAAQNCHHKEQGAFTGEVSAQMVASTKSKYVLIGHSERRQYFNESNEQLAEKIKLALIHQLKPVFCIGENLEERNANRYFEVIQQQLKEALFSLNAEDFENVIIAYEPVWAIGTGNTASTEQVQEIHSYIRGLLQKQYGTEIASLVPILYGGSCNATNAKALFSCEDVDGGLIGGASLLPEDFVKIIKSF